MQSAGQAPGRRGAGWWFAGARRASVWAVALLALLVVLVVMLVRWTRGEDTLTRARREGFLRVGYAVEAPYAFLTPEGEVTGESPEIARAMVRQLGIPEVEWRLSEFGSLIDALEGGRIDVIAAGMFITPERARRVAFSRPTFAVRSGLLVRRGNPFDLHSYADVVRRAGVRVAVISGSVEERRLLELRLDGGRLVHVPDALSGQGLVESGGADGLALSAPTVRWVARTAEAGRTEVAQPFVDPDAGPGSGLGAFAFRKEDRTLREAWDRELEGFIGTARHRHLVEGFGFTPGELPPAPAPAKDSAGRR